MLPMKRMHESDMFARMQDVVILLEGNGREYEGGWCSSTLNRKRVLLKGV